MTDQPQSLDERLRNQPHLRERFEAILAIVEDTGGNLDRADAAEMQVIAEVRRLGNAALQGWAVNKEAQKSAEFRDTEKSAHGGGKKTPLELDVRRNSR